MSDYFPPLRHMQFLLNDVFEAPELWAAMPATQEVGPELVSAILEEGAKITSALIAPLSRIGDEEGARFDNGKVTTPEGFVDAYKKLAEGGWIGLGGNPEFGGQGLPKMLTVLFEEMLYAADSSFTLYPALTSGAALAINAHASESLKKTYLPRLYKGEWAGAMCLTEPHAGTDLGIIKTRAVPKGEGSYAITGTKIFITGGEHDLTKNIIHLVLAKLPDAPEGPKGISLFLVPKIRLDEQGQLAKPNAVVCGAIEHKMGIKASATCVMHFEEAEGYLIGELNQGLACMFTMMNYERLSIGLQGLGCAQRSLHTAMVYAHERLQSRAAKGAVNPDQPADPILVHPDVRRMLLTQRAYTEAGRAFALYTAEALDKAHFHPDDSERGKAADKVALLTPIAKAFLTDKGFDSCVLGQQVLGGHGYIREWGQEQRVRDARIAQIYEGTNGIQALDLARRKIVGSKGKLAESFYEDVEALLERLDSRKEMAEFVQPLKEALQSLRESTADLLAQAQSNPDAAGAASCDYLHLFGHVIYAYLWVRIASVACTRPGSAFYAAQVDMARYYFARLLPMASYHARAVKTGAQPLMAVDSACFEV
ncbi:MAG: acyl-CoA dehydrogenase C-terminal domain-containing protein [Pseudomonadales bacterium]|nr:acyl-CoA dehydrogenase C-terminal domain-containing protein [Pseudomonadales bacterium]